MQLQKNLQDSFLHNLTSEMAESLRTGGSDVDYSIYQENPVEFIADVLGVRHIWPKLVEICEAVESHPYVAIQSANSVGKTFIAARVVLWWLNCFTDNVKIITTAAPPERQIKELLWGEIKAAWRLSTQRGVKLIGNEPGAMSLRVHDSWWAQGFTVPMTGTKEERIARFQGHHAEHMLFILDEASGIPSEVWEAVDSCMSGGHNHLLVLANPMAPSGPFYAAVRDPKFKVIKINAFDHPNVVKGKNIIPGCVTREVTMDRLKRWSRQVYENEPVDANCFTVPEFMPKYGGQVRRSTSPFLEIKTLGRFPTQATDALINLAWIQSAQARWVAKPPIEHPAIAGLDVAEMGVDANAWLVRRKNWVSKLIRWNGVDPLKTGGKATEIARKLQNFDRACVDSIGPGTGVAPHLVTNNIEAIGVKVSWSPTIDSVAEGEFRSLRDQLLWSIREWLRTEPEAMLPPDPELAQELAVLTYEVDIKGKIVVMQKKNIRKLIGRSPDALDALALTFYRDKPWKRLKFVQV